MGQMDYKLRYLMLKRANAAPEPLVKEDATSKLKSAVSEPPVEERAVSPVRVLLHFKGNLALIEALGFRTTSRSGDIAAGFVSLDALELVAAHPNVISIESSRPLRSELDVSAQAIRLNHVRDRLEAINAPNRGRGVIIGIIDSGFDFGHPCFCEASGESRILSLWDQNQELAQGGNGRVPQPFGYGVEYDREVINAALRTDSPTTSIPHLPRRAHGTHVTGIAASNGRAAPENRFLGVAPEAELILVSFNDELQLGDSAFALDAISYIVRKAQSEQKPVVINLSQGDNFGPHDGTSLLELAIDNLLGQPGVAFVKSAGNERDLGGHASGTVKLDGETHVEFEVPPFHDSPNLEPLLPNVEPDTFDLWYKKGDLFDVVIQTPDGSRTTPVAPESSVLLSLSNGNEVFIRSQTNHQENGDNRINIILERGQRKAIERGLWKIILLGRAVSDGSFHIWIDRSKDETPRFTKADNDCTITIPGTSEKVITVGSFVTKLLENEVFDIGELAPGSSLGPTRANSNVPKPDLTAPGYRIMSSVVRLVENVNYELRTGTSMAAPHVAGIVALLLERNPKLTQAEIKRILQANTIRDRFTGPIPNNEWGHGKLNAGVVLKFLSQNSDDIQKETTAMQSEQVNQNNGTAVAVQPNNIAPENEVQAFELLGDKVIGPNGESVPINITVSVQSGAVVSVTATDSDGMVYTGALRFKLEPITSSSNEGDECQCCEPSPTGRPVCRICPCTS